MGKCTQKRFIYHVDYDYHDDYDCWNRNFKSRRGILSKKGFVVYSQIIAIGCQSTVLVIALLLYG